MKQKRISERKRFSIITRIKSANRAWRGLGIVFRTTHNFWGELFFTVLAIYLGYILDISTIEWSILILVIGIVLLAEVINTSIEIDIDLTSPEYHPYAKDTKDVAAGAVLLSIIIACIIGFIIFVPKIMMLFF